MTYLVFVNSNNETLSFSQELHPSHKSADKIPEAPPVTQQTEGRTHQNSPRDRTTPHKRSDDLPPEKNHPKSETVTVTNQKNATIQPVSQEEYSFGSYYSSFRPQANK